MKKKLTLLVVLIMVLFSLTGCNANVISDEKEIDEFNSIAKNIKESENLSNKYTIPDGYTVEYKGNSVISISKDGEKTIDYNLESNQPRIVQIDYSVYCTKYMMPAVVSGFVIGVLLIIGLLAVAA